MRVSKLLVLSFLVLFCEDVFAAKAINHSNEFRSQEEQTKRIAMFYNKFTASPKNYYDFFAPYAAKDDFQLLKMVANFSNLPTATAVERNKIRFMINGAPVLAEIDKGAIIVNEKRFAISIPLNMKKDLAELEEVFKVSKKPATSVTAAHAQPAAVVAGAALYAISALAVGSECLDTTAIECTDLLQKQIDNTTACMSKSLGLPFVGLWNGAASTRQTASMKSEHRQMVPKNVTCGDTNYPSEIEYFGKSADKTAVVFRYTLALDRENCASVKSCHSVVVNMSSDGGNTFKPVRQFKIENSIQGTNVACVYDMQNGMDKMNKLWNDERSLHQTAISTGIMACANHADKTAFLEHAENYQNRVFRKIASKDEAEDKSTI